jgi:hypothetical protein
MQFLLSECITSHQAKTLLSSLPTNQIKAITEVFHNLFHSNLNVNNKIKKILKSHRGILQKIAKTRTALHKRQKLIKKYWCLVWTILKELKNILKQIWS